VRQYKSSGRAPVSLKASGNRVLSRYCWRITQIARRGHDIFDYLTPYPLSETAYLLPTLGKGGGELTSPLLWLTRVLAEMALS
jgi:hypothetical protein